MKNIKRWILPLFIFFFLSLPVPIHAEEINSFTTVITINTNGIITVRESIVYNFGSLSRHGIFRTITMIKTNTEGKKFHLNFDHISVTNDQGDSYRFSKKTKNNKLTLKIGDPDKTITGIHTYVITYTVSGALTYFSDHDELYWNSTGNEWNVPISAVQAKVYLPKTFAPSDIRTNCFTGSMGSTEKNCITVYKNGIVTAKTNKYISSHEGLTIIVSFPKGIVAVVKPKPVVSFFDTFLGKIIAEILILIGIIAGVFWYIYYPIKLIFKWQRSGRDPLVSTGVTRAWFDPPKNEKGRNFTPGETGALVDETVDMKDITSTIIDLARRGYIRIIETKKKDYSLKKLKDTDNSLLSFEKTLIDGIFKKKDLIRLKNAQLYKTIEKAKDQLYDDLVSEGLFPKNPDKIRKFYTGIATTAFTTLNIPLFLIALTFGRNMPRKTPFGREKANIGLSLKNFLSSQERQLTFQAKKQLMFERLLPYAVAFGVEKIWAKRFENIDIKPPEWYQGYQSDTFSSTVFIHSLNSSMSTFSHTAIPTSSSSGFSSGFSGGSSGGGGGGGGGGSW